MEDGFEGDKTGGSSPGEICWGLNEGIEGEVKRNVLKRHDTTDSKLFPSSK